MSVITRHLIKEKLKETLKIFSLRRNKHSTLDFKDEIKLNCVRTQKIKIRRGRYGKMTE